MGQAQVRPFTPPPKRIEVLAEGAKITHPLEIVGL